MTDLIIELEDNPGGLKCQEQAYQGGRKPNVDATKSCEGKTQDSEPNGESEGRGNPGRGHAEAPTPPPVGGGHQRRGHTLPAAVSEEAISTSRRWGEGITKKLLYKF